MLSICTISEQQRLNFQFCFKSNCPKCHKILKFQNISFSKIENSKFWQPPWKGRGTGGGTVWISRILKKTQKNTNNHTKYKYFKKIKHLTYVRKQLKMLQFPKFAQISHILHLLNFIFLIFIKNQHFTQSNNCKNKNKIFNLTHISGVSKQNQISEMSICSNIFWQFT